MGARISFSRLSRTRSWCFTDRLLTYYLAFLSLTRSS